jgi:hypothetical protein
MRTVRLTRSPKAWVPSSSSSSSSSSGSSDVSKPVALAARAAFLALIFFWRSFFLRFFSRFFSAAVLSDDPSFALRSFCAAEASAASRVESSPMVMLVLNTLLRLSCRNASGCY